MMRLKRGSVLLVAGVLGACGIMGSRLDDPATYAEHGKKEFAVSRQNCFNATKQYFKESGHGIEREDADKGTLVSGRSTVSRSAQAVATGTNTAVASQTSEDTKFYVQITGSDSSCTVSVAKMRVWSNAVELEEANSMFIDSHLHSFLASVSKYISDQSF